MVEYILDLLIEFDEMGFIPSTTCPDPEGYAKEWKRKMLSAVNRLKRETIQEIWKDIKDYNVGMKEWMTFFQLKYGVREKTEKEKLTEEIAEDIINKVNGMSGGKMIAQALREIYLEKE
jgi:hypothetical protein